MNDLIEIERHLIKDKERSGYTFLQRYGTAPEYEYAFVDKNGIVTVFSIWFSECNFAAWHLREKLKKDFSAIEVCPRCKDSNIEKKETQYYCDNCRNRFIAPKIEVKK